MSDLKLIEHFFKTFFPMVDIHIHFQWDNHYEMDRPHLWRYNVEMLNVTGLMYNPETFTPVTVFGNGDKCDTSEIYPTMSNFIPHIYPRISVFHMDDKGMIFTLNKFEEPHRSF
jgi:hypothetical protein